MPAQHTLYHPFRYDGHGHSLWSDGRDTPGAIVAAAIENNIQVLGLCDHDTVEGLPGFLDACHRANKTGHHLLPIPSVELTTTWGDLLIALPFPAAAHAFIQEFPRWRKPADPMQAIQESILRYHAICIFLHPETPYVHGFTIDDIDRIYRHLPRQLHRAIGIETHNWMSQIFFWNRSHIQRRLHKENQRRWDWAEFSFTDYHRARHVGKYNTTLYMKDLSPASFVEAITTRQTLPQPTPFSWKDFLAAGATSIQADVVIPLLG